MKILNINSNIYNSVSFQAMKKRDFTGTDLLAVERFKAPIEKFNSNEDFQNWADIKSKEYTSDTIVLALIYDDLNNAKNFTKAEILLMIAALMKEIKKRNYTNDLFNMDIFKSSIAELREKTTKNPKEKFNLFKLYKSNYIRHYLDDDKSLKNITKWVYIPSKKKDKENFESNINKLKILSAKWCTRKWPEAHLKNSDFHIYIENGIPRVAIKVKNGIFSDKITEIQGPINGLLIPSHYYDIITEYLENKNLKMNLRCGLEFYREKKCYNSEYKNAKVEVEKALKENDIEKIFKVAGIKFKKDTDNLYIISHYNPYINTLNCTMTQLGINEQKLFLQIKEIEDDADFVYANIKDFGALQSVKGTIHINLRQREAAKNIKSGKGCDCVY